jgi:hypothetical protein
MTNRDIVRNVLTKVPGNKRFSASNLIIDHKITDLTSEQVGKALRTQKNVKRVGTGKYMVKGRKV